MSDAGTGGALKISAIVCTFNRADVLGDCLAALEVQSLDAEAFEVIIVDNASTDDTAGLADAYVSRNPNFKVVREEKQGLAAARNRGMREATSAIAAFTDDDAIPSVGWLEQILQQFEGLDEKTAAVGGEIDPVWEIERPKWLVDRLLHPLSVSLHWSDSARYLQDDEWLCEANSAYRIAPVVERGGFPEHLGRIGANLLSGENAVNSLLLRDGFKFFFDPSIRVRHQIPASRMTRSWFRRRLFWQGVTTYFVHKFMRENACEVKNWVELELPLNEEAWLGLFGDDSESSFQHSIGQLYNLGYLLASQNLLSGR